MSHYIVGSDRSGKSDNDCIEKVCQVLRDNGHTADNIGVTPNLEAQFRSKGKGCIGVFLVNGICIGTMDSVNQVVKGGLMDYWFIGITKSYYGGGLKLPDELSTKKLAIAHDDNFTKEPRRSELNGNYTVAEFCQENSQYMAYAYGDDCEAVAQSILNGGNGGGGGGTGTSSEDKSEPTPMSYLDMIKDLISVWDGDVECKVRQDKMYINKVPQPNPKLWVIESNNIVSGQAKVTDYNSDTVNTLNVDYDSGNHRITITDEYLINRFGEVSADVDAIKIMNDYSGTSKAQSQDGTSSSSEGNGGSSSLYTQISEILQKYYEKPSEGWNSFTNNVRLAKTGDEIRSILAKHKKKKGQEYKSHVAIGHEIQKIREMPY